MTFGATILTRLAEASLSGQDGIVVFFPDSPEIRIPGWVIDGRKKAAKRELALRVIPVDPEWHLSERSA